MATRCMIIINKNNNINTTDIIKKLIDNKENNLLMFYKHCDGYPESIVPLIYLNYENFTNFHNYDFCEEELALQKFELADLYHSDIDYLYVVNTVDNSIIVAENTHIKRKYFNGYRHLKTFSLENIKNFFKC